MYCAVSLDVLPDRIISSTFPNSIMEEAAPETATETQGDCRLKQAALGLGGNGGAKDMAEVPQTEEAPHRKGEIDDAKAAKEIEASEAPAPLFGDKPRSRSILVAVDASPGSILALECVLSTMATREDMIILFHAYPNVETVLYPYRSAPILMMKEAQERKTAWSEKLLTKLAEPLRELQVNVKRLAIMGDSRDALLDAAKSLQPDFVVVGSHGYGMVKRTLLGSVSSHMAHHAECPLIIVRQPPSGSKQAWATIPGLEKLRNLAAQAA